MPAAIFLPAIAPRRTSAGGFTERRYTPVDVLELLALAELRRRGFTPAALRQMMDTLRDYFRRRLSETLDDAGEMRLLTDGRGSVPADATGPHLRPARRSDAAARHRRRAPADAGQRAGRRERPAQRCSATGRSPIAALQPRRAGVHDLIPSCDCWPG